MALISLPNPLTDGTIAYGSQVKADLDTIVNDYNGNIQNANIAANAAIVDTKLAQITTTAKVSGLALTGLASTPAGAGVIPAANLPVTTPSDAIAIGFEIVYSSPTAIIVNPGLLFNGSTAVPKTTATTLTLATAGDWYDLATHTFGGGAGWCYIGANSAGDIRLLGANPPNKTDTANNANGTLFYSYIGSTYWRVLGQAWVHTDNTFLAARKLYHNGNRFIYDDPYGNTTFPGTLNQSGFTDVDLTTLIPAGTTHIDVLEQETGGAGLIYFRKAGSSATSGYVISGNAIPAAGSNIPVSSTGHIEYKVTASATYSAWVTSFVVNYR
jgi:hypothetical protein